jgi:DNA-binding transcriptional LysR family regulator
MTLYPQIKVEVFLTNQYIDLVSKGIDAAIRSGVPDASLVSHHLGTVPYWICATPAYLATHPTPNHPQDLMAHTCLSIASENLSETIPWSLKRGKEIVEVKVPSRLRTNDFLLIKQLLMAGNGMAFVPSSLAIAEVKAGTLVRLISDWHLAERGLYLVYPSDRHLSPKVRAWIEFVMNLDDECVGSKQR